MTTRYEVVLAPTREEALKKAKFQVGDLVRVVQVEAVANQQGSYSVFPIVEPLKPCEKRKGGDWRDLDAEEPTP